MIIGGGRGREGGGEGGRASGLVSAVGGGCGKARTNHKWFPRPVIGSIGLVSMNRAPKK